MEQERCWGDNEDGREGKDRLGDARRSEFASPLFFPKLHHRLSGGVTEETAEVGNIVVVHLGGDLLDGKVGLGEVVFEFVNDGIIDEGFGGGLHQAVADFVQIVGTEAQLGGIELHTALMMDVLAQQCVEAVRDTPNG